MLQRFVAVSVKRALNSTRSARCGGIFKQNRSNFFSESSKAVSKSILFTKYATQKSTVEVPIMPKKTDLFNLDKIAPFQKKMLRASKKEVTLPDFLRDFVGLKTLYAAFDGDKLAAMSKTLTHIPTYKPKVPGVEPLILFVHTDDSSLKVLNPNSKLQLRPIPFEFVVDVISGNISSNQLSHLIIDPGLPWSIVLNEENFRFVPVYYRVQKLDQMVEYLWQHSPHSLNPSRTDSTNENQLRDAYHEIKMGPFVVCKTDEGLLILDNESTLPVWSSLDVVKEFLKTYPQYLNDEYQAYLTPRNFWNVLSRTQKHGSFIEFNPGTKQSRKFKASLLTDLYDEELDKEDNKA